MEKFTVCQITSRAYSSKTAIRIEQSDFSQGGLPLVSFVRPDKLFTADSSIIKNITGIVTVKLKKRF